MPIGWRLAVMLALMGQAAVGQSAVAAELPVSLAPSSKWQIDYASGQCRLLRSFGGADNPMTLQLASTGIYDEIEMALAGRQIPVTRDFVAVSVGTSTVTQVPGMHAQGAEMENSVLRSLRFPWDVNLLKALRADAAAGKPTILSIAFIRGYAVTLDLGSMQRPLAALDTCLSDLAAGWGIDMAAIRVQRSGPVPVDDPAKWFAGAFPNEAERDGVGGIVRFRLVVAADGSIRKCEIYGSGGDKAFEEVTCERAMKRGRFRPAIGADGHPLASLWQRAVRWNPGESFFTVQ